MSSRRTAAHHFSLENEEDTVKLVTFQIAGKPELLPGLFTDRGVVSIADAVPGGVTPTATMTGIIDNFDRLRPTLERLARDGKALPTADVRLRAPLPRPGKSSGFPGIRNVTSFTMSSSFSSERCSAAVLREDIAPERRRCQGAAPVGQCQPIRLTG